MAPHSSTLAWKIPWTEEPGRLQSMGSLRVGHNWAASLSLFSFIIGEGNGNPVQCSCLENPRDRGAWWGAVYGVSQNRTRLNDLAAFPFSKMYLKFCDRCSVEEIQGITSNVVPCRGHQNISSLAKMMQNTFAWINAKYSAMKWLWFG